MRKTGKSKIDEQPAPSASDADENGGVSDEDVPISKKMKMVTKSTPTKNGDVDKRKKPTAELEGDTEYEVDHVVGSRVHRGKRQFRIRWKGFEQEDDTWEAEEGLTCPDAIKAYLEENPEDVPPEKKKSGKSKKLKDSSKKKGKKEATDDQVEDGPEDREVKTEEYEVDKVEDIYIKKDGKREFLIRWKGYGKKDDTWEPEEHLHCGDLITKYLAKVDKAKSASTKELRQSRTHTERFTLSMTGSGRRLSRRQAGKQRPRYHDAE